MNLTRIRTILAVAAGGVAAGAVGVKLAQGALFQQVAVPWAVPVLLVLIAGGILAAAWPVRQYVKGKRRRVDPLRAASILALAKSCTLAGAALAGLYLGMVLIAAGELHSPAAWERLWQELAAAGAAALLSAAGRTAEWFCRLPPEEPKLPERHATKPSPA
ncbi:MAG: DUF3180 domain-containing protein [Bifidobacteriaceae bacterium]|jgi:uncharacterized membrane protein YidH (DUF202 family)|nr:DUF3180 domain-containing protein [Bifidobacteriaceae bacterium]